VGAAVGRAGQCVDTSRNRSEHVGFRRTNQAHGGGRAVLLVVCVQDQQQVKSLDHIWIRDVWLGGGAEAQAQEVLDHVHRVVRVQQCLANRLLVRVRGQYRQLCQQAQGRTL